MSSAGRGERLSSAAARLSDRILDFVVLAVGAWTVIYHACLVLGVAAVGAMIVWAASLVPCAWLAFARQDAETPAAKPSPVEPWARRRVALLFGGYALAAAAGAAVYAFADARWTFVWLVLFLTASASRT
jgi:hypothetical protein